MAGETEVVMSQPSSSRALLLSADAMLSVDSVRPVLELPMLLYEVVAAQGEFKL